MMIYSSRRILIAQFSWKGKSNPAEQRREEEVGIVGVGSIGVGIGSISMATMSNRDGSGGGWFVYDESSDSYDINTRILATAVIFLAAVVILMIVLHLYLRHVFFRRSRNDIAATAVSSGRRLLRFYVTEPAHDDHVAAPGLDPSAIAALLARPYRSTMGGDGECAICLSAVEDAEMVRVLPGCGHLFHVGCIDMWLGSHCTCPVCRAAVEPPSATTAAADGGGATTPVSQEEAALGEKESESASSFRRILSWERSTARRPQGQGLEDPFKKLHNHLVLCLLSVFEDI